MVPLSSVYSSGPMKSFVMSVEEFEDFPMHIHIGCEDFTPVLVNAVNT
jgi:hypothetical protein